MPSTFFSNRQLFSFADDRNHGSLSPFPTIEGSWSVGQRNRELQRKSSVPQTFGFNFGSNCSKNEEDPSDEGGSDRRTERRCERFRLHTAIGLEDTCWIVLSSLNIHRAFTIIKTLMCFYCFSSLLSSDSIYSRGTIITSSGLGEILVSIHYYWTQSFFLELFKPFIKLDNESGVVRF